MYIYLELHISDYEIVSMIILSSTDPSWVVVRYK